MAGRGADVRERMVQAGLELFTERGFASVSLIQVVERASAPRGSIYHHFPGGKKQLSIEVAVSWRHTLERVVLRLGAKADSPESFLRSYVEHFRTLMTSADFGAGCPLVSLSSDVGELGCEELRVAIGLTFSTIIDCVSTELLRKGVDRARAPMIAATVCSATHGALTISRATRTAAPFEQIQAMIPSLLVGAGG
jgi:TetR/AcrR family transcriptional repressor of lmrAB and yxaGH operons